MTPEQRQEIERFVELQRAATPGPWIADCALGWKNGWFIKQPKADHRIIAECGTKCEFGMKHHPKDDFAMIAASRTVPVAELLAENTRLQHELSVCRNEAGDDSYADVAAKCIELEADNARLQAELDAIKGET